MPEYKDLDDMTMEKMCDSMEGKRDPNAPYRGGVQPVADQSFLKHRTYFGDPPEPQASDDNSDSEGG